MDVRSILITLINFKDSELITIYNIYFKACQKFVKNTESKYLIK